MESSERGELRALPSDKAVMDGGALEWTRLAWRLSNDKVKMSALEWHMVWAGTTSCRCEGQSYGGFW